MKTIKIAGFTIKLKQRAESASVSIFEGNDKMPLMGIILYGSILNAEEWAVHKISTRLINK